MATKKNKNLLMSLGLLAVTGIVAALYSSKVLMYVKKVPGLADIDNKLGDNAGNAA